MLQSKISDSVRQSLTNLTVQEGQGGVARDYKALISATPRLQLFCAGLARPARDRLRDSCKVEHNTVRETSPLFRRNKLHQPSLL